MKLMLMLLVVLAGALAAPALAQAEQAPADLTHQERIGWGVTFSAETKLLASRGSSRRGCRSVVSRYVLENWFGLSLWAYHQKLGWCWRSGRITSATARCKGTTPLGPWYFWWDFKGYIGCRSDGGVGRRSVLRWRMGKWRYCPPRVGCIQTKLPVVWVRGYGNGSYRKGAFN